MIDFSVVIINYNKNGYLQKVAEKVKVLSAQSELVLSDDHSNDGSYEWAVSSGIFDQVYRKGKREEYCLCTVRNEGIRLATREFIILLDADCLPDNLYFSGHTTMFEEIHNVVSIGITRRFDKGGLNLVSEDDRLKICRSKHQECGWELCYGGNVAFRKELWSVVGGFDEAYNGCWGFEDLDFSYRLGKQNTRFFLSQDSSVRHLEHPYSQSATDASQGRCRNATLFERKHGIRML